MQDIRFSMIYWVKITFNLENWCKTKGIDNQLWNVFNDISDKVYVVDELQQQIVLLYGWKQRTMYISHLPVTCSAVLFYSYYSFSLSLFSTSFTSQFLPHYSLSLSKSLSLDLSLSYHYKGNYTQYEILLHVYRIMKYFQ